MNWRMGRRGGENGEKGVDQRVPNIGTAVRRALRKRCPRCGEGAIFSGWYNVAETCGVCRLPYEPSQGGTWAFMYISTAFMTGLIVTGMLLVRPPSMWVGRAAVFAAAMVLIVATLPYRKAIAIALEYIGDARSAAPEANEIERRNRQDTSRETDR